MTSNADKKGPGVKFPPPLVFLCAMLISYWLNNFFPLLHWNSYFWVLLGSSGIIICIAILGYALLSFYKAKTHIEPWQPASHLITTGLYSHSRNPIYVTFFALTISIGLMLSNYWMILSAIPSLIIIRVNVIAKEEQYLEQRFNDSYINYKKRVNRWL